MQRFFCVLVFFVVLACLGCNKDGVPPEKEAKEQAAAYKESVSKVLAGGADSFQQCYLSSVKDSNAGDGKIILKLEIDEAGKATATAKEDSFGDGKVAGCVADLISRMAFPIPPSGKAAMDLPLKFSVK